MGSEQLADRGAIQRHPAAWRVLHRQRLKAFVFVDDQRHTLGGDRQLAGFVQPIPDRLYKGPTCAIRLVRDVSWPATPTSLLVNQKRGGSSRSTSAQPASISTSRSRTAVRRCTPSAAASSSALGRPAASTSRASRVRR